MDQVGVLMIGLVLLVIWWVGVVYVFVDDVDVLVVLIDD